MSQTLCSFLVTDYKPVKSQSKLLNVSIIPTSSHLVVFRSHCMSLLNTSILSMLYWESCTGVVHIPDIEPMGSTRGLGPHNSILMHYLATAAAQLTSWQYIKNPIWSQTANFFKLQYVFPGLQYTYTCASTETSSGKGHLLITTSTTLDRTTGMHSVNSCYVNDSWPVASVLRYRLQNHGMHNHICMYMCIYIII